MTNENQVFNDDFQGSISPSSCRAWFSRRVISLVRTSGIWQQLYSCKTCRDGWRLPHKIDNSNKATSKQIANDLGGLNFETNLSVNNKHGIKSQETISSSTHKKLIEPEPSVDRCNSRMHQNLLGQVVNPVQKSCDHNREQINSYSDERTQPDELNLKLSKLNKNKRLDDFG